MTCKYCHNNQAYITEEQHQKFVHCPTCQAHYHLKTHHITAQPIRTIPASENSQLSFAGTTPGRLKFF